MNKINSIIALAAAAFSLTACNLDQGAFSEIPEDGYVRDDQTVENLVIGMYNSLQGVEEYEWAVTELRSDNARSHDNNSTSNMIKLVEQFDQGTIAPENEWVAKYWDACYATIARANNVIGYASRVSHETKRKQFEGEALFLRSLEYFNIVRLWGPAFIVKSKTPSDVARNMQRSPVEDVYSLIEGDLERVISEGLLPEKLKDSETGRATLIAAKALLAKVYATHYKGGDAKYDDGIRLCREVLQSSSVGNPQSGSDLVAYNKVFDITNEMNREIIFAVRYLSGKVGLGSPFGNMFAPINNGANVILGNCNNFNCPSDDITSLYDAADVRRNVNIADGYTNQKTGAYVKARYCCKYTYPVTEQRDGESDWPVIRVADIALLYAEMVNEKSGPSEEALKYLNMIRQRAGLADYSLAELSGKYDFREAVRKERREELAFENQRWFDLLRWGIAKQTVNDYLSTEAFYRGYRYSVKPISDWQVMLPVPVSVMNINPDAAQNVGY